MAFNAQGGMFQQHLQALVNPGGQFTVQQARKYIYRHQQHLQALVNPGGQFTVQQARKYIYRH